MPATRAGLRRICPDNWEDPGRTFVGILIDDASSYVFDVTDEHVADIVASEVTEDGYTRATLSSLTTSWDATNERWRLLCSAADFGAIDAGIDVAGMWIAELVNDDTDSVLISYDEFASAQATDGNTFTVTPTSDGVLRVA